MSQLSPLEPAQRVLIGIALLALLALIGPAVVSLFAPAVLGSSAFDMSASVFSGIEAGRDLLAQGWASATRIAPAIYPYAFTCIGLAWGIHACNRRSASKDFPVSDNVDLLTTVVLLVMCCGYVLSVPKFWNSETSIAQAGLHFTTLALGLLPWGVWCRNVFVTCKGPDTVMPMVYAAVPIFISWASLLTQGEHMRGFFGGAYVLLHTSSCVAACVAGAFLHDAVVAQGEPLRRLKQACEDAEKSQDSDEAVPATP